MQYAFSLSLNAGVELPIKNLNHRFNESGDLE